MLVLALLLAGQLSEPAPARGTERSFQQAYADDLKKAPRERSMRLTADVVSRRYCEEKPDVYVLSFRLKAKFTNVSHVSLVLRKDSELVDAILVGENMEEAKRGKYEYVREFHRYVEDSKQPKAPMSSAVPNESEFVVLQPGASYERTVGTWVAVRRRPEVRGTLGSGDHALQLFVQTWPYYEKDAKTLRRRWQKHGRLVSLPILSEPVALSIDPDPKLEDCSKRQPNAH